LYFDLWICPSHHDVKVRAGKSNHSAGRRHIAVLMFKEAIGSTGAELYGDIHQIHLVVTTRARIKSPEIQFAITLPR
jgi:hypothetical protein